MSVKIISPTPDELITAEKDDEGRCYFELCTSEEFEKVYISYEDSMTSKYFSGNVAKKERVTSSSDDYCANVYVDPPADQTVVLVMVEVGGPSTAVIFTLDASKC